jgi:hypothetical protein
VSIALNVFLAGIYYAAIVLRWKTIWPAIALHSLLNALVAMFAFYTPGFQEPAGVLFLAVLFQIPVAILAFLVIARIRLADVVPGPA